ncbi:DUF2185 domain-containing protein [Sphingomonas endolithica]|uniref:DUF2185 domain-containing protein n=1 Tax=Sphingomonas endolithica TaxID=2972485 RepID=UPI0021B00D93|nr:DUF2185 domain-containing protein [Sphingomonas sp. ZFBP2030]
MPDWPFDEPQHAAVIATRRIIEQGAWVAHVYHDMDDGGWQFLDSDPAPSRLEDAKLVPLRRMVERDPASRDISDLPLEIRPPCFEALISSQRTL